MTPETDDDIDEEEAATDDDIPEEAFDWFSQEAVQVKQEVEQDEEQEEEAAAAKQELVHGIKEELAEVQAQVEAMQKVFCTVNL